VVGSILGVTTFDIVTTAVIAVIFIILVWIIAAIIPGESPKELKSDEH